MKYFKLLLVFLFLGLLTACGDVITPGTYQVQTGAMGVKLNTGHAEIQKDRIMLMASYSPVASWERDGNVVTALDKDGNKVFQAREEDDGKTLAVMNLGAGLSMTLTRLD